jgi:histidyl-tRNA synthetase
VSQRYAAVKGMNDLLPAELAVWHHLEATAREVFGNFAFSEIRTPIVEDTALFVRSVGEGTDIVGKEMYTFLDKSQRSLTLRPEGTAPAARAYIEHAVGNQEPVTRWFYLGQMFRYERMKTGRYRSFWQLGAEAYGSAEPAQDVEVLALAVEFFKRLGISGVRLELNSLGDESTRPAYGARIAEHFAGHPLSDEARATLQANPLRLLDSKEEALAPLIASAPSILESLDDASRAHFAEVQRLLTLLGIPWQLNPRIVRGLDYYTRTAFEFTVDHPALGPASTVCGGGRYDRLVHELGGNKTPAVGFAMGVERLCLLMKDQAAQLARPPVLFIASLDAPSRDEALRTVMALRAQGHKVDFDTRGGSLKAQMKRADASKARYALVLGEAELRTRCGKLKRMDTGEQREVSLEALAAALTA